MGLGVSFGLSGSKSKSSSSPWGPQIPFLTDVWNNAQAVYRQNEAMGRNVGSQMSNTGLSLMPGLGSAFNYWNSAMNGDPQLLMSMLRDPYRALQENELPGIATNAIGMGSFGGSRPEIAAAIANRGFMDRATDLAAQLRSSAADSLSSLGLSGANLAAGGVQMPMDLLSRYADIIQAANWGGSRNDKSMNFDMKFGA